MKAIYEILQNIIVVFNQRKLYIYELSKTHSLPNVRVGIKITEFPLKTNITDGSRL